jgi:hypothetical protein
MALSKNSESGTNHAYFATQQPIGGWYLQSRMLATAFGSKFKAGNAR